MYEGCGQKSGDYRACPCSTGSRSLKLQGLISCFSERYAILRRGVVCAQINKDASRHLILILCRLKAYNFRTFSMQWERLQGIIALGRCNLQTFDRDLCRWVGIILY
jgi:hypothetical protein